MPVSPEGRHFKAVSSMSTEAIAELGRVVDYYENGIQEESLDPFSEVRTRPMPKPEWVNHWMMPTYNDQPDPD